MILAMNNNKAERYWMAIKTKNSFFDMTRWPLYIYHLFLYCSVAQEIVIVFIKEPFTFYFVLKQKTFYYLSLYMNLYIKYFLVGISLNAWVDMKRPNMCTYQSENASKVCNVRHWCEVITRNISLKSWLDLKKHF